MSSDSVDRKIAVILATDVVGYSKHMETNEKETVKNLKVCEKILTKTFENHKGRLFNTGGDSFLIEFPSAVEAVECAVSFQEQIKKRNTTDNPTVPLEFRIGINTGDVIQDNENLLGDGVNIAARLEALAQPKGITISKAVYDFIKGKTNFNYNDLGIQKIKQNEFHAYDILLDPSQKRTLKTQSSTNFKLFTVIAIPLVIALVSFLMFSLNGEEEEITEFQETSKPVILVTPIKASGLSEDQQGFARGITESMISTFSRYTGIRVLSSSTSFHVSEKNMTDEEILDEYGVNFVIRGSMQVMGNNARLNVEVTDLKIGEVVKTEKRDFELSKIFKIQDEISDKVLGSIQTDLGTGEYIKTFMAQLDNIEDFTMSLNWIRTWRSYSPEGYKKSKAILDELNSRYPKGNPFLDVLGSWQISQKIRLNLSDDVEADKKN
jgi:class 3 adenylate cyclase/TolB-like protein